VFDESFEIEVWFILGFEEIANTAEPKAVGSVKGDLVSLWRRPP
jgi:hypothetical protein